MNKILCPVDFSSTSLNAIEFAVTICKKTNCNLILIHVFTEEEFNQVFEPPLSGMAFEEKYEIATNKLDSLVKRINEDVFHGSKNDCSSVMVKGKLIDFIIEISAKEECDLIVMGTTGSGGTKMNLVGSNTEEIVKKSTLPVLCIPKLSSFKSFDNLVYATDIRKEDTVKIQDVISFATYFESRIHVVHLLNNDSKSEANQSMEFISELETFVSYNKIKFEVKKVKKDFNDELLEYIQLKKAKMLFVYSPQRSYFRNLLHKSFYKRLSVTLNTPIYVLK